MHFEVARRGPLVVLAVVAEGTQGGWEGTAVLVPGTSAAVAEARKCLRDSAGAA